jgi:hypothetical protein
MDLSNNGNMQNGEMGQMTHEDDLQAMADKVVQEESEELVFEETESELEVEKDNNEEDSKGINILGFTLEMNHLYMLGALVAVLLFFFKDHIMEAVNSSGLFNSTPSDPLESVSIKEQ